ncbi:MAG: redox-regulated ATPase YchF [Candidatus Komeilibacteria bacterium]
MSFSLGIVGLPNVGKSTLFQALTKKKVDASNYPFCTIDPNVGVVAVPDERLAKLAVMSKSDKIVPTAIEFVDIAGLVKGASTGEGLGNKFLTHIREVDAIAQVVRAFEDPNVIHVHGQVDPIGDREVINLELILADLEVVNNRLSRAKQQAKGIVAKEAVKEIELLEKIKAHLEANRLATELSLTEEEVKAIRSLNLLTLKPMIYIYNVSEDELAKQQNLPPNTIAICAKIESEVAELPENERQEYLQALGIKTTGLDNLISTSYKLLNLLTFITTGPMESKAWTIVAGTKAPQAAGVIHTDFEQGFIRAEVVNWQELLNCGSWNGAREQGKLRMEGKDYIMQDGDVVHFHFN